MKSKLLLKLSLFVITLNTYAQDNSELSTKISNSYVKEGSYKIYSPKDAEEFENLKFIEFVKLDETKFDFAKIVIPKIVIVDKKQGDDIKKNQKRMEFFEKNSIEKNMDGLELTKSKFDFNNSEVIILGNSELYPIYAKGNSYLKRISFQDNVIAKYQGEKSNNVYYIVDFGFYGIIEENEYNKPVSERINAYKEAAENIANIKSSQLREESKKWFGGNFIKLFPEEKIYMYDVSYLITGPAKKGSPTQISLNSIALSNISPNSISKEDFPTSKEINYVSYKYVKDFNVLNLIYYRKTRLDSIYECDNKRRSSYSYWEKGESQDPILDLEKDAIFGGEKDISKFDFKYFLNKVKEKNLIKEAPLYLNFVKSEASDSQIEIGLLSEFRLRLDSNYSNKDELIFAVAKTGNSYTNELYEFQPDVERKYDIRVDKPNFNFTIVDLRFIEPFFSTSNESKIQSSKESLEELIAKELSAEIIGFNEFVKESKNNDKEDEQYKQTLIKKYGAKYTNEAINGNIIVGMPEGLLPIPLRFWVLTSRTDRQNGYTLYFNKLTVTVENGKVSRVSKY